jgi:hypothetical protein
MECTSSIHMLGVMESSVPLSVGVLGMAIHPPLHNKEGEDIMVVHDIIPYTC